MDEFFAPVEFPFEINLPPSALHRDMYKILERQVRDQLSGVCRPNIGYIKPGSVEIVKKLPGQIKGSHATGNVTFRLQVRCQAMWPIKGQRIPCAVIGKNDAGILAQSFSVPYMLFIPKIPGDPKSDDLDRIAPNSDIEVRVLTSTLKAPSKTTKSEYWVICELDNADIGDLKHTALRKLVERPILIPGTMVSKSTVDRQTLTDGAYLKLERSKEQIDEVIDVDYRQLLEKHASRDPVVLAEAVYEPKKDFVVGKIVGMQENNYYSVKVLYTNKEGLDVNTETGITIGKMYHDAKPQRGNIILYYSKVGINNQVRIVAKVLDFWGLHVKYIVNQNEMIHLSPDYANQLAYVEAALNDTKEEGEDKKLVPHARQWGPVSRSYYKMREIYKQFNLLAGVGRARILCIAESPGGFIQALADIRAINSTIKDSIVGVSVAPEEGDKTWGKLVHALGKAKSKHNLQIRENKDDPEGNGIVIDLIGGIDGDDGKGNILDDENISNLIEGRDVPSYDFLTEENKADLVTADGGIPHDKTDVTEEMDTSKLVLAEILLALKTQKLGGSFVLKIFDMATEFTAGLLSVLSYCYDTVSIFKPVTSRNASSEKYLICNDFGNGVDESDIQEIIVSLSIILDILKEAKNKELVMDKLVAGGIDGDMKQAVLHFNIRFMKKQMSFINDGVTYTKQYCERVAKGFLSDVYHSISAKANMQYTRAEQFYVDYGHY